MELTRYLELLRSDTERIAVVADSTDLTRSVAACPGWSLADLVYHVGEVHRFWHWIVAERIQSIPSDDVVPVVARPPNRALSQWLRAGLADFIPSLQHVHPSTPLWSWTQQQDMAFIQRRMPQETSVHRWDAERVAGVETALDADLAVDGVDEFFLLAAASTVAGHDRLGLVATDTGDSWTASVHDGGMSLRRDLSDADGVLRGTASDLLLILWRRLDVQSVDVTGDNQAVERFLALADLE